MTIITDAITKLKTVISTIDKIVREELVKERKLIAQMNREQLLSGKKASGENMPSYVLNSRSPSSPGLIKLFDEGLFQDGIEPMFDNQGIELVGTERKTGFLIAKYGEILGLTDKNIKRLQKVLLPKVITRIKLIL